MSHLLFCLLLSLSLSCHDSSEPTRFTGSTEFEVDLDGYKIAGEIHIPEGAVTNVPVIIVVPGSGQESRAESQDDIQQFSALFGSIGFATVFYDLRGVGKSTGNRLVVSTANSKELIPERAKDVQAIINKVKTHEQVDPNKIGMTGGSQGAWVTVNVQGTYNSVNFILNTVGGASSVGISDYFDLLMDDPNETIELATSKLSSYQGELGYDPLPDIQKIDIPVMWNYGDQDTSHPTFYDLEVLSKLSKDNFTIKLYVGADHNLNDKNTGQLHAEVVPTILGWLSNL